MGASLVSTPNHPGAKKSRRRTSCDVSLVEFMRQECFWPLPYSIEMAFQVLRCLMVSGIGYKTDHRWHTTSVSSLVGGQSPDNYYPKPIISIDDLRQRFLSLMFNGQSEVEQWRREKGINAYATVPMEFLHYKPLDGAPALGFQSEHDIKNALDFLLVKAAGQHTSVSLNSIHHSAKAVHGVDITIEPDGFCFTLRFGFLTPEQRKTKPDSEWDFCLARTQRDMSAKNEAEPFLDTLRRALDCYAFITRPENGHLTTRLNDRAFIPKIAPTEDAA